MNAFLKRLSQIVSLYPQRIAAEDDGRKMTYAQIEEESGKIYHALKEEGIGKGDCVLIVMKRTVSFFPCIIGVLKSGACLITLEDDYPPESVRMIYHDAGCKKKIDDSSYEQMLKNYDYLAGQAESDLHDVAYIVYTSGSTGTPKGVIHEYGNINQQVQCSPEKEDYPEFKYAFVPPFNFVASLLLLFEHFPKGSSFYMISKAQLRDYKGLFELIEREKIQGIYLPPSYLRLCDFSETSLVQIQTGSEPASGICSTPHTTIRNIYSMSECGFELLTQVLDKKYDPAPVGKPVIDVDVHLVDDDGNRVEGEGKGELCFKSEYVRGYVNLPEKTAQLFRNGYYYTGDLAERDSEGRYYIIGRKDDMIKINGNRIEPLKSRQQSKKSPEQSGQL